MKTTSVITSLSRRAGGVFDSVRSLHQSLAEIPGMQVKVLGLYDEFTEEDLPSWRPIAVETYAMVGWRQFAYSPGLRRRLLGLDQEDILHTHGIWEYPSIAVTAWHRKYRRPYMISPHGMLDPWAVKNSAWKKRLAASLYERSHLASAACIRALCESEVQAIRKFGLKNPICIIPNGVDLLQREKRLESSGENSPFEPFARRRKVLLYLGRIHPKKGLVNLLRAWKSALHAHPGNPDSWVLAIVGWDQGGHEGELRRLRAGCGLENSVHFLGPQFGADKAACYQECDAFILPSVSEGLPVAILEAWSYGKPVLMTPECNLPEGFAAHAAHRIDPSIESIAKGLHQLFAMSDDERQSMGNRGLVLVKDRFTWPKIAGDLAMVYQWLLGGGPKPACVVAE
jgi:poly(glycerol-phosphate) alpha-glucosyltransferase